MTAINHVLLGLVVTIGTSCAPPPGRPPKVPDPGATPGNPEVPIDPNQPMPADSLSTGATLVIGTPVTVIVDGRADLYSSGMAEADPGRAGKLPGVMLLARGTGYLTFSSVKGVVGCAADAATSPDGGDCGGGRTELHAASGISGIVDHEHTQFLAGVFLGPSASTEAPSALDFSANALGESLAELAPLIGQSFYIGDGLTEAGVHQRFVIPAGATRFFMAFADGYSFQGDPGAYGDNTGGLRVSLIQQPPGATAPVSSDVATDKAKLQKVANALTTAADGLTAVADQPAPAGATAAEKKAHADLTAFARSGSKRMLELQVKTVEVLANKDASALEVALMSKEVREWIQTMLEVQRTMEMQQRQAQIISVQLMHAHDLARQILSGLR